MKVISSLQFISQRLAVRLFTRGNSSADRQRGASALEYLILAAAIIFIVGVVASNDAVQTTFSDAFAKLFTDASTPAPG